MKITLHISHAEADDLARAETAARRLGWQVTSRGGFMGKHHTELCAEMSAAALAEMLELASQTVAVVAA
jgi:hypothetical protein